jgi:hypothetical protein
LSACQSQSQLIVTISKGEYRSIAKSYLNPATPSWGPTSPDPGDDFLVDCGMNADAAIVTSNLKDLKIAQASLGLLVLTPAELVIKLATDR